MIVAGNPSTGITATDNCDSDVEITFAETTDDGADGCNGTGTITRTWIATDNCGNTTSAVQIITISDDVAPVLANVPADETVECDQVPAAAEPTATDDCDATPAIALEETRTDGACEDSYVLVRTWTATDACGNTATAQQVVTVDDTTDPVLANVPADVTLGCTEDLPTGTGNATATDNCDSDVEVTIEDVETTDPDCALNRTIVRTFTATDNCGNTATAQQTITIGDNEAPILAGVPTDVTVECDDVPAEPTNITATDDCDTNPTVTVEDARANSECEDSYVITRTFTATDACGNSTQAVQVIVVNDITDPILSNVPSDITINCNEDLPSSDGATATDNCDSEVEITIEDVETADGDCEGLGSIVRTFTATDNCGNSTTAQQVIVIQDAIDPVLAGVPSDVTVECDAVPAIAEPTATDNCDTDPAIEFEETRADGSCEDSYVLVRTWTATDACGNATSQQQVITIDDTTPPVLSGIPVDIDGDCAEGAGDPSTGITATDNCDSDVEITFSEVNENGDASDGCAANSVIIRTWIATDNCGNTAMGTQRVSITDNEAPVLAGIPADETVECDAIPTAAEPTVTDNCDASPVIALDETRVDGECEDSYVLTRTWTATDACGNTTQGTQVIVVNDTTDPILGEIPADITLGCNDNLPNAGAVSATDNCDSNVEVSIEDVETVDPNCALGRTIVRTYTATDNCGNIATAVQTITITDETAPVLANLPVDATVECDEIPDAANVTATDDCDTAPTVEVEDTRVDGDCENSYVLTRTWTATDACGNSTQGTQVIVINDTTDPVLANVPADITINCGEDLPASDGATATDNCDSEVEISIEDVESANGDCEGLGSIVRTFTATDNCGNITTAQQVIVIQDAIDPVLADVPSDVTVECDNVPAIAEPTATDNCDTDPAIEFEETRADGSCEDSYVLVRTWTATDACGNATSQQQVITVDDTTPPVLSGIPADIEGDCAEGAGDPTTGITATDNCDSDVEITFSEVNENGDASEGCSADIVIIRTWIATDNCGNTAMGTQRVSIIDNEAPVLASIPSDETVECDALPAAAEPTVTDNCDASPIITLDEARADGNCEDSYVLTRTWTATDACGNTTQGTQVIVVNDTTDPVLGAIPADITLGCTDNLPTADAVNATDNCDSDVEVTIEDVETVDPNCALGRTIVRTYTATDNCGNTATGQQTIIITDETAPVLANLPADATVECDQIPDAANVTATDDCDTAPTIEVEDARVDGDCEDSYVLTRTWTATDACGNSSQGTQVIVVNDTTDPIFANVPADITISCEEGLPTADGATAVDNCDNDVEITIEDIESANGDCEGLGSILRTYTATDNCGNTATAQQVIVIQDAIDPEIANVPSDVTVECDAVPTAPTNITATDNCDDNPTIAFEETRADGSCEDSYVLVRTWTATDACGNATSAQQVITIDDTTPPVLSGIPGDIEGDCADGAGNPTTGITATDNCDSDVEITFTEVNEDGSASEGCSGDVVIIRTWIATDNCGNTAMGTQRVSIVDNEAPVLAGIPSDETVECDAIPDAAQPTVTDNCDASPIISLDESRVDGDCEDSYVLTRTWTATDACGNTTQGTQVIVVNDTTDPVLAGIPADITVDGAAGEAIPDPATPTATDNCDEEVTIELTEVANPSDGCGTAILRTWTATDNCGNTTSGSQTIILIDDFVPAINPTNTTICLNTTTQFTANPTGAQYTYEWTTTGGTFSSTTIADPIFTGDAIGTFDIAVTVTDTEGNCVGDAFTQITVTDSPTIEAMNNGPLCAGQSLRLTSTTGGTTYAWTGPNNFTSSEQNPVIDNVTVDNAGEYEVTIAFGECTGTATTRVEIGDQLSAEITGDVNACLGSPFSLSVDNGTTFAWTGPNGFTSSEQTINIAEASQANAGRYEVEVSNDDGCSVTLSAEVSVLRSPAPFVSSNSPACAGGTLELFSSGGVAYSWTGPNNFTSEEQNPIVSNVMNLDPGTYTFTVEVRTEAGCTATESVEVTILEAVAVDAGADQVVCRGDNIQLTATGGDDYLWTGPSGYFSTEQNPVIENATTARSGLYILQATIGDACQATDTVMITINDVNIEIVSTEADNCEAGNGIANLAPANLNYTWSDGGTGASRTELTAGTYTVTATDDNNCTSEITVIIGAICECQPAEIADLEVTEASCGESNGSAIINLVSRPSNYLYTWTPNLGTANAAGNGRTDIPAGTYTVVITFPDADNCSIETTIAVGSAEGPEVDDIVIASATCTGGNGSATITPTNYIYIWSFDNFTGNSRTDLDAGMYQVVVLDPTNADCPTVVNVEITIENTLEIEAIVDNTPACGEADGSVSISVNGGTGNYSYTWVDDETITTPQRSGLAAGTYQVMVMDTEAAGCETMFTFTLNEDVSGATVEVDPVVMVACNGDTDGNVEFTVNLSDGFVEPADVEIQNAAAAVVENGSLAPGDYCIIVKDANGCFAGSTCFEVQEPTQMEVSVSATDKTCDRGGRIGVLVAGGNGQYTFDWADIPGTNNPQNRINLEGGTYNLVITDQMGCQTIVDPIVIIDNCDCEVPTISNVVVIDAECGEATGSASINVNGSNDAFNYTWLPNVSETFTANNLEAGAYSVTISVPGRTDCQTIETFVIGNSDGPVAEVVETTPANCLAFDGTATLAPSDYSYTWSDGNNGSVRTNLGAATYTVTVTDPTTGCQDFLEVIIDQTSPLAGMATVNTQPTCGAANGSATIVLTGGSGNYSYSWGNSATQDNLPAGTYNVAVVDNTTGCETMVTFTLLDNVVGATITVDPIIILSCVGATDGSVIITADLENGFATPATEEIMDGNGNVRANGTLGVGNYCVVLKDANGCVAAETCFEVVEPAPIMLEVSTTSITCDEAGSIDITAIGGTGNYNYDWVDLDNSNNEEDRTIQLAGTYSVTVTDENGCTAVAENITIADECDCAAEPVVTNTTIVDASCGLQNGSISIDVAGNPADYTYFFLPNVGVANEIGNTRAALQAGNYTITIAEIGNANCFTTVTLAVNNIDGPEPIVPTVTPATCLAADGSVNFGTTPANITFLWSDQMVTNSRNDLIAGTYAVEIIDSNTPDCPAFVTVEVPSQDGFTAEAQINNQPTCGEANGSVTILTNGGVGPFSFDWGLTDTEVDLAAGTFDVNVVDNGTGCLTTVTFTLTDNVSSAIVTVVPRVFTSCIGANDGAVSVDFDFEDGFAQPFTTRIQDADGGEFEDGSLAPGSYCLVVADANGCIAGEGCFTVVDPSPINVEAQVEMASCDPDGAIIIISTGGTGEYTYDWADLEGTDNIKDRENLPAGTYSITVSDQNNCLVVIDELIINSICGCEADAGSLTVVSPVCIDQTDAVITATAAGDMVVPNGFEIRYVLTEGEALTIMQIETSPEFTVADAGNYTIHTLIYDPITLDLSIVVPGTTTGSDIAALFIQGGGAICGALDINGASVAVGKVAAEFIEVQPENCNDADGLAVLSPSIYEYAWSNGGTGTTQTGLTDGTYTVTATDTETGCTQLLSIEIDEICDSMMVNQCVIPVVTNTIITDANCDIANGSAMIMVNGNMADYTFTWTPNVGTRNAPNFRDGLTAGSYEVVIARNGMEDCQFTQTIVVGNVDAPQIPNPIITPATCLSPTGGADFSAATGDLTYTWSDGSTAAVRTDLLAITYSVTITDTNTPDCPAVIGIDIPASNPLVVTPEILVEPSCGENNGSVRLNVSGGTGPYSYSWGNSDTQNNLSAGLNEVTVIDNGTGCQTTATFTLTNNVSQATLTLEPRIFTSCFGANDGNIAFEIDFADGFAQPATTTIQDGNGDEVENGSLMPGGYCIVILDANGCVAGEGCFAVADPSPINVEVSPTNKTCDESGNIILNVTGGTGAYTFNWADLDGNDNVRDRDELEGGLYSVEITDENNCSVSIADINVLDECATCNPPVIINTIVTDANCNENNGAVTITVDGNVEDYTFTWIPNLGTATAPNVRADLLGGAYEVIVSVTGVPNCSVTQTAVVGNTDGPEVGQPVITPATCVASDGVVDFSGINDTYTYVWSDGVTAMTRTDIAPGTYAVTVTDPNEPNCPMIVSVEVPSTNPLTVTPEIITQPTCGENNGTVRLEVTGGTGPYSYSWGNSDTQTILPSGTNTVTVIDNATGCEAEVTFTLTDAVVAAEVILTSPIMTNCVGENDGNVTFTLNLADGFAEPASTTIQDGNGNTYENGELAPGDYCVVVRDANDCIAGQGCFVVLAPEPINVEVQTFEATTGLNGSILLNVTGGSGNYNYNWADLDGTDNPGNRTNLSAGTYSVIVTDENNCTVTIENIIIIDAEIPCILPVVTNTIITDGSCGLANGTATINLAGELSDYTIVWSPNIGTSNGANSRTELMAGTYTVEISATALANCSITETVVVGNTDAPIIGDPIITAANCLAPTGGADFSAVANGFTFAWSDGETGAVRTNLLAITYGVTVTNPSNADCPAVISVEIPSQNTLTLTPEVLNQPNCGESNGVVRINATGGVGPFSYSWGDSDTQTNLPAGLNEVTVTDNASGCTATTTFTLTDNVSAANITLAPRIFTTCVGANDGQIDFDVTFENGFAEPATIQIQDGNEAIIENGNLAPNNYCVVVLDANGCFAGEACFTVVDPSPINIEVQSENVTCDELGTIILEVTGGTGIYRYNWADLDGNDNVRDREDLSEGTYTVEVRDENNCTVNIENIVITTACENVDPPVIENTIIVDATCGNPSGSITIMVEGNEADYTYEWTPATVAMNENGNSIASLFAGAYEVKITDKFNTNNFIETVITVSNTNGPDVIDPIITPTACLGATGSIDFTAAPAGMTFFWNDINAATNIRTDLNAGAYIVVVTNEATPACPTVVTIEVPAESTFEAEAAINRAATCGESDGSATIIVNGGTGPYTYSWGEGDTRNDLAAGIYEITIVDNGTGCSTTISFNINDNIASESAIIIENVPSISCIGVNDGEVLYTVEIDQDFTEPVFESIIDIAGNEFENGTLAPGEYCVKVMDGNGCIVVTECFTVATPEPLKVEVMVSNVTCDEDGTIEVIATGGTGTLSIVWNDAVLESSLTRTGLTTGTYGFGIVDANGCEVNVDGITIADECGCQADAGTITLVGNATVCYEMQPITVSATPDGNDVMPEGYSTNYVLTRGNELLIVQASETPSFEVNMIGTYSIHTLIYDPANFNFSDITVGVTNAFEVNAMLIQGGGATCGSLDVVGATIQIEDCNVGPMCDNPVVTNVTVIEATCGNTNGAATVNVQGTMADYNFAWSTEDGISNNAGNLRTGLMAGAYTVTITLADNADCETIQQIAIGNVDGPVLPTPVITPATCLAGNGSIDFSGAPANLTFTWADDFSTRSTRANLPARTYIVTVNDSNVPDCPQVMAIEVPTINTLTGAAIINQQPTCGQDDGSVTITVANGVGPFNFSWNADRSATRMDLTAGTYEVVVVDEGTGCMTEVTFTLTDRVTAAGVLIDNVTNISCPGEADGAVSFTVNESDGFASPATTQITDGNGNVFESGSLPAG